MEPSHPLRASIALGAARVKRVVRDFVVESSGTPLVHVYRGAYRAVIAAATAILRRHRSVVAIYLCRGCARDDIIPGISDIDLVVVIEDGSPERAAIQREFRAMKSATAGLVDYYATLVNDRSTILHRWNTVPAWRYRYQEGQGSWRLLHGEDVIRALPPLTELQRRSGVYAEMNRWWLMLAERIEAPREALKDNVTCYKSVTELLCLLRALPDGGVGGPRASGLTGATGPLAERLRRVAARRFLGAEEGLLEETLAFLIRYFLDVWATFPQSPYLEVNPTLQQSCDAPREEVFFGPGTSALVRSLEDHVKGTWGDRARAVHLVKSAFWDFDDLLMIFDADPADPPAFAELASLVVLRGRLQAEVAQRVLPFLRVGPLVFPLTPTLPWDLHKGVLTPATMPDVFLQLGDAGVSWTGYTRWYLCDFETNDRWRNADPRKLEQLRAVARSFRRGHVVYPLTEPALRRAAEIEGD